jgi:hypothetical protein
LRNHEKHFKIPKVLTYASELFAFDLSHASTFFDQINNNSNIHENMAKGFAHFLECLDKYYDVLKINSTEGCKIKIFGSVTLANGNFLRATGSFHDRPWFSNLAVAMDNEELFDYLSDSGICYAQVRLL